MRHLNKNFNPFHPISSDIFLHPNLAILPTTIPTFTETVGVSGQKKPPTTFDRQPPTDPFLIFNF
jgi:hypothetical protein